MLSTLGLLSEIHPNLPLRVNVIEIRWGYSAMMDRRDAVSADEATLAFASRRALWAGYVRRECDTEMLHLPSHQVVIN
jgi:hypothetical protein